MKNARKTNQKNETHMKTKTSLLLLTLALSTLVFSFYNEKNAQAIPEESTQSLDTAMEKYSGLYVYLNHYYYSVGKFPGNTKVHPTDTPKYFPLEEKFVGDYFIVEDRFVWETSKVDYVAAPRGNLMLGVGQDGTIHIQNYLSFTKPDGTMDMGLGGTGTYGKFVPRADGHYDLKVNNALYTWTKK
jgi:hypothetical protein